MTTLNRSLRWILGGKLTPTYIQFGDATRLDSYVQFLSGIRAVVERVAINVLPSLGLTRIVEEADVIAAWDIIQSYTSPRAGFLLYTGYYKETVLVGAVERRDGTLLFVKVFRETAAAEGEVLRAQQVKSFAEPFFRCASILLSTDRLVAYEMLERRSRPIQQVTVENAAIKMCSTAMQASTHASLAPWTGHGLLSAVTEFGLPQDTNSALTRLKETKPLTLWVPNHGDLTPWNVFSAPDGAPCLVDYERVGTGPPFSDIFHFYTQPAALAGRGHLAMGSVTSLPCRIGQPAEEVMHWFAMYLAMQLELDLNQWIVEGRRHRQLGNLIRTKASLLAEVVFQHMR